MGHPQYPCGEEGPQALGRSGCAPGQRQGEPHPPRPSHTSQAQVSTAHPPRLAFSIFTPESSFKQLRGNAPGPSCPGCTCLQLFPGMELLPRGELLTGRKYHQEAIRRPPRCGLTWPPDSAVTAASSFRSVREASQHPPRTPVGGGPRAATLLHLPANETHERAARQALLGSGRQVPAEPTHSPAHPHLWGFRLPPAPGPSLLACSVKQASTHCDLFFRYPEGHGEAAT